jgi:hypothetical protein
MLELTEDVRSRLTELVGRPDDGSDAETVIDGRRVMTRWWQVDDGGANYEVWQYVGNHFVPSDEDEANFESQRWRYRDDMILELHDGTRIRSSDVKQFWIPKDEDG